MRRAKSIFSGGVANYQEFFAIFVDSNGRESAPDSVFVRSKSDSHINYQPIINRLSN